MATWAVVAGVKVTVGALTEVMEAPTADEPEVHRLRSDSILGQSQ